MTSSSKLITPSRAHQQSHQQWTTTTMVPTRQLASGLAEKKRHKKRHFSKGPQRAIQGSSAHRQITGVTRHRIGRHRQ